MSQKKTMIIVFSLTSTLAGCVGSDDESAHQKRKKNTPLTANFQHYIITLQYGGNYACHPHQYG